MAKIVEHGLQETGQSDTWASHRPVRRKRASETIGGRRGRWRFMSICDFRRIFQMAMRWGFQMLWVSC